MNEYILSLCAEVGFLLVLIPPNDHWSRTEHQGHMCDLPQNMHFLRGRAVAE